MRHTRLLYLVLTTALIAPAAHATPTLLAIGTLDGATDLSGLSGLMENGLPANVLGGLGSGFTYAGGNTFLAVPDRGPNATPYNNAVDNTTSYISRFQTLDLTLTSTPGGALPYSLSPTLVNTTLLSSPTPLVYGTGAGLGNQINGTPLGSGAPTQNTANTFYFTGRSDNFDPTKNSGNPANGRFDPESVRVSNDGKSVFISDEYGPYVRQFDRATGSLVKTFALPQNLNVTNLSPSGATETATNTSGRTDNKGMEGLAITPDGKTLVGIMQAPLIQDAATKLLRIVTIDIATGATKEFAYNLTNGSGVSEIIAINDHEFLVDERDGKGLGDGSVAKVKQFFRIDLTNATDITNMNAADATKVAVKKTQVLDLVKLLTDAGIAATQIPAKIEGMAFGDDIVLNGIVEHTLYITNDNDFLPDSAGPNKIYVVGLSDADLANFQAQEFVSETPLPPSVILFGTGLVGIAGARWRSRRRASVQQA